MCYSAMVEQDFKSWLRWKNTRIDIGMFERLFRSRLQDNSLRVPKALEANFYNPRAPHENRIKRLIEDYHRRKCKDLETEVFKQKQRLAKAERSLTKKETKKALEDQRIATKKIKSAMRRIDDLTRAELQPNDSRIFPFWYAPVMVIEDGQLVIKPMRYHCRLAGKPASYDRRYPGLYNARRDNLEKYWKNAFGQHHAMVMVTSFFENVALHDYEQRPLRPGESSSNVVLEFNPQPSSPMLLACLWDRWESAGEELHSFAIITDEPPPEVAATGHNRCPIALRADNVAAWLAPQSSDIPAMQRLLDDRERPFFEHRLAA